jgi:predicted DsbA family dithiol-disulfide isomerase
VSMTQFGLVLCELMEARGLDLVTLSAALAQQGYEDANEETLARYQRGELEVDDRLPRFLAQALMLSFEEKKALAMAYTYGQDAAGARQGVS